MVERQTAGLIFLFVCSLLPQRAEGSFERGIVAYGVYAHSSFASDKQVVQVCVSKDLLDSSQQQDKISVSTVRGNHASFKIFPTLFSY